MKETNDNKKPSSQDKYKWGDFWNIEKIKNNYSL